jgi:hypothetical protein
MKSHLAVAVLLTAFAAATASAATLSQSFTQSAHVNVTTSASGCENNPGPYITLDGGLSLSGLNAKIILTNNAKFTHVGSADIVADVSLIPLGQSLTFHKQPSQGGVGGNPWIYFQYYNKNGDLSSLQLLGRCVQGLNPSALNLIIPQLSNMTVTAGACDNTGGPYITIDGALVLGGLNGRIVLSNNAKLTHAAAGDITIEVVLIPEGQSLTFHKQPPLGGAGGNPIIYVQFTTPNGTPLSDYIKLGRCNKL